MELNVHGKQMDVGDALRTHVSDKLEDLNEKYFNHATFATVTFSKEGHGKPETRAHISIQLGKNIMVVSDATDGDPYASFEAAAEKVGKQMRRYKRRLKSHQSRDELSPEQEEMRARDYVLAAVPEQDDTPESEETEQSGDDPLVIAEMDMTIESLSVSDAVMKLDLSGKNALPFKNSASGKLNIIYRRDDGNIGWIDPETAA